MIASPRVPLRPTAAPRTGAWRRRLLLPLAPLLVVAFAAFDGPAGLSPDDYIIRAYALEKRGDMAGAIASLEHAAAIAGPTSARGKALYQLALYDLERRAPGANPARGWQRLEEAAYSGNKLAAQRLLAEHVAGRRKPTNVAAAAKLYQQQAAAGSNNAALLLGDLYASGALGAPNLTSAETWYARAATQSNNGKRRLALLRAAQNDDQGALAVLQGVQTRSVPELYRDIAQALATGAGVPRNRAAAARWAARADQLDPPKPKSAKGPGTKKPKSATGIALAALTPANIEELRRGAAAGDAASAARLADAIEAGVAPGAPQDIVKLRTTAVEKGRADVSDGLVRALGTVPPTAPAAPPAVNVLTRAAEAGSADSMAALGRLYSAGGAVKADMATSTQWYEKAAQKGNTDAQFRTGMAYAGGVGVKSDEATAKRWLGEAASGGHALARTTLEQMDATTPPADGGAAVGGDTVQ